MVRAALCVAFLTTTLADGPPVDGWRFRVRVEHDNGLLQEASSRDATAAGTWSPAVSGVRGRLIATAVQDAGRPGLRLELELENVSDLANPIEIWWTGLDSMLDFTLEDQSGKPLPRIKPAGNVLGPGPFWHELLHQSTVRVVVARDAYYSDPDRFWFRPTTWQAWAIAPPSGSLSRLFIRAMLTAREAPEPRERAWRGPLALPRIAIPNMPATAADDGDSARSYLYTPTRNADRASRPTLGPVVQRAW